MSEKDQIWEAIEEGEIPYLNNRVQTWRHAVKPCRVLHYCPYGALVELFPIPEDTRQEAIERIEHIKKSLAEGVYDEENKKDGLPLLTREEAEEEIKEFNPEDHPEKLEYDPEIRCEVFGHCCPAYYLTEPMSEEGEATNKEGKKFWGEMVKKWCPDGDQK